MNVWIIQLYSICKSELILNCALFLFLSNRWFLLFLPEKLFWRIHLIWRLQNFTNSLLIFTSTIQKFSPFNASAYDQFYDYFSIHKTVVFSIILIVLPFSTHWPNIDPVNIKYVNIKWYVDAAFALKSIWGVTLVSSWPWEP